MYLDQGNDKFSLIKYRLAPRIKRIYNPLQEDKYLENYHTEPIPDPTAPKKQLTGSVRIIVDIIETFVIAFLLFVAINYVSARIRVDGSSMEPTLHNGEFVVVNKLAYKLGEPKLGDVIVFQYPHDPEQEYIKRVIGTPGDRIVISEKRVYVNDQLINEPYIKAPPIYEDEWIVPDDSLFVLGDNRNNSSDSNKWGFVPLENVIGKAVFVYWPPDKLGVVEHISGINPYP